MLHHTADRPATQGRTISWGNRYDLTVQLLMLGQAGRMYARIADRTAVQPGDRVLDVACGTGSLALVLAGRVGPSGIVAGVDASPEMIAQARQKARRKRLVIDFRVEAVEAMAFADETFDRVVSSLAFHHFPGDLKRQALESTLRVLKPGGSILIVDVASGRHIPMHGRLRSGVQDLAHLLQVTGFTGVTGGALGFGPLGFVSARKPGTAA
jgi:ubiquinone/menaquinone biosynthesis C-methylase UbiE